MRNVILNDEEKALLCEAWKYSKYSRESIERPLTGGKIVAVYPLFTIDETGNTYDTGLSIVYQVPGSDELKTLDITTENCCSRDDEVTVAIADGFVYPDCIEMEGLE